MVEEDEGMLIANPNPNPNPTPYIVNPQSAGMVEEDEGMLIIRLPGFDIPLIVRKSDGGFGYDSTDMAGECPLTLLTLVREVDNSTMTLFQIL